MARELQVGHPWSIAISAEEEKVHLRKDLNKLLIEENLHLCKNGTLYKLKTKYKRKARKTHDMEAIAMDFPKKLILPTSL